MGRPQRGANAAVDAPVRPRRWVVALPLLLLLAACSGSGPQTTLDPAGPIAEEIDQLWLLVFWIAVVVFVLVEAALVISIFRFRERPGDERRPKQLHGNTRLEIIWTIIPAVLLAGLSVPMLATLFNIREVPEGPDVLTIQVIGHQWWWEFQYPEGFTTANELHIPADTKVNLEMTSVDVIHSFWVPKLNGKRDVVPGRVTNLTLEAFEPTETFHPGQCAEFCGLAHADMRLRVFVDSAEDYAAWVDSQLTPAAVPTDGLAGAGYETFVNVCTACHNATVDDPELGVTTLGPVGHVNGVFADLAPDLGHFGSRSSFGSATFENVADHMDLRQWLREPASIKPMDPDRNIIAPLGCAPQIELLREGLDELEDDLSHEDGFSEGDRELREAEFDGASSLLDEALVAEASGDDVACVMAAAEGADTLGVPPPATRILGMPNFGLDESEIDELIALLESWE